MADYPGAIKTFTEKENKVDLVDAQHVNDLQDEVVAVQTELGTDVAGSETDLKTRVFVNTSNDGSIRNGTSFPGSPITGQLFFRTDQQLMYIYGGAGWISLGVDSHIAGDVLQVSADDEHVSDFHDVLAKVKEIQIPRDGTLRIKFDAKQDVGGGDPPYAQVYRNGVAVGTLQRPSSTTYATFSEDISGWTAGDLCQLYYAGISGGSAVHIAVRNFRIYEQYGFEYIVNLD